MTRAWSLQQLVVCALPIARAGLVLSRSADGLQRRQPMSCEASATHLLSAGFGVVLPGFVAMSQLSGSHAPAVLHVDVYSPLLLALYLLALTGVHAHERPAPAVGTAGPGTAVTAMVKTGLAIIGLALAATCAVSAAPVYLGRV